MVKEEPTDITDGRKMDEETPLSELLAAFLPENGCTDEIANQNLLDDLMQDNNRDLVEDTTDDIWLVWALSEDRVWYLCCRCETCGILMQYPGVRHNCPVEDNQQNSFQYRGVVTTTPTSMEELLDSLLCDETDLLTEN